MTATVPESLKISRAVLLIQRNHNDLLNGMNLQEQWYVRLPISRTLLIGLTNRHNQYHHRMDASVMAILLHNSQSLESRTPALERNKSQVR